MNFRKVIMFVIVSLFISIFSIASVQASIDYDQIEDIVDPDIPDSWYEAPETSSQIGITNFQQAPILKERVKQGELPEVNERLPKDAPVIEPYKDIGKYGGTAYVWTTTLDWWGGAWQFQPGAYPGRATPDATEVVPYLAEEWNYSNDYKELTLKLREGVKWSDGEPFTAEDIMFWWEYVENNEDLTPIPPQERSPWAMMDVEKKGEYEVKFYFDKPNPTWISEFQAWGFPAFEHPAHHMKQFHIEFQDDKEKFMEKVTNEDLDNWFEYYEQMNNPLHPDQPCPTLQPYILVEEGTDYLKLERNPYYPFVDIEGNQLPYIDNIRVSLATENEMIATKAVTGEATMASLPMKIKDIPLYKRNEEDGDYQIYMYLHTTGGMALRPNLNHSDPEMRNIFQDLRFRKALAYAIDMIEIDNKAAQGSTIPTQPTILPGEFYEEEFRGEQYLDASPEKAKELLDDMGMIDVNDDGYRERPDGEEFNPTILYSETGFFPDTSALELTRSDLQEIGIDVDIRNISGSLLQERALAGNFDITQRGYGGTTDLMFPRGPNHFAPVWPMGFAHDTSWPLWMRWYETNGEKGMEPTDKVKELIENAEKMALAINEEERLKAGKEVLKSQIDNLWNIGVLGYNFRPVLVSNNLNNVPKKGFWGGDVNLIGPYYSAQFYLEE